MTLSATYDAVARALAPYDRATPTLLERRQLLRRCDQKFLLAPHAVPTLIAQIAGDYAVVAVGADQLARYANLYFDTAELRCFHDHRRGRRLRHKIRIRSYVDRRLAFLEVKSRRNELVTEKSRLQIAYGTRTLDPAMRDFLAPLCPFAPAEAPVVAIDYRRVMLIGIATRERVTIDLGITIDDDAARAIGAVAIVEVKQPSRCMTTPVLGALRGAGAHPAGVSKYMAALAERAALRGNRLRPGLRLIERMVRA